MTPLQRVLVRIAQLCAAQPVPPLFDDRERFTWYQATLRQVCADIVALKTPALPSEHEDNYRPLRVWRHPNPNEPTVIITPASEAGPDKPSWLLPYSPSAVMDEHLDEAGVKCADKLTLNRIMRATPPDAAARVANDLIVKVCRHPAMRAEYRAEFTPVGRTKQLNATDKKTLDSAVIYAASSVACVPQCLALFRHLATARFAGRSAKELRDAGTNGNLVAIHLTDADVMAQVAGELLAMARAARAAADTDTAECVQYEAGGLILQAHDVSNEIYWIYPEEVGVARPAKKHRAKRGQELADLAKREIAAAVKFHRAAADTTTKLGRKYWKETNHLMEQLQVAPDKIAGYLRELTTPDPDGGRLDNEVWDDVLNHTTEALADAAHLIGDIHRFNAEHDNGLGLLKNPLATPAVRRKKATAKKAAKKSGKKKKGTSR